MKIDEDEASNSVKTSIEAHRTDVLKAVIDTIKKGLTSGRVSLHFSHIYLRIHAFLIYDTDCDEQEFLKFLNCSREDGTFLHLVTKVFN